MIQWNARSLRRGEKQVELVETMMRNGVDVCAVQETWLGGSAVRTIERTGHTFVLENEVGCKRRGVAIVLSRQATDAWDAAERKMWVSDCKRLLAVRLKLEDDQGSSVSLVVMSGYRPLAAERAAQEKFDEDVVDMFDAFSREDVVAFGVDMNGSVGVEFGDAVGRFGLPRVNDSGRAFREAMSALECAAPTSFMNPGSTKASLREVKQQWRAEAEERGCGADGNRISLRKRLKRFMVSKERELKRRCEGVKGEVKTLCEFWKRMREYRFASWTHPGREQSLHQLDHWWVKKSDMRRVCKASVSPECLGSDHRMVVLEIRVACKLKKVPVVQAPPKPRVNRELLRDPESRRRYIEQVKVTVLKGDARTCAELDKFLVDAAECTLMEAGRKHPSWWMLRAAKLEEACKGRDAAMLCFKALGRKACRDSPESRELKRARANVQREVREAKRLWLEDRLERIEGLEQNGAPINPADAWKAMDEIERGLGELRAPTSVPLRDSEGRLATTPEENLKILRKHFFKVFNRESTYDRTVIDTLEQRDTLDHIGREPDVDEIRNIFNCAKSNKAAGLSGSFIEEYKVAMTDECVCKRVHAAIVEVWRSAEIPEAWKKGKLKEIGKGGGKDLSVPGNYRGIMLLDVVSKVMSALINRRLQELLKVNGRESQNGFTDGRGCRDSSFALRLALQTLREHGCTSWVAFIDLVKAFDSVDRTAMCDVLKRYGAPESLVRVVRALHKEVIVVLKAGGKEEEFESKLGVIQGAAASPTLFLFMISAWLESADWKGAPIKLKTGSKEGDTCERKSFDAKGKFLSQLLSVQRVKRKDVEFEAIGIRDFLYADDAALVFESRESMERGLTSLIASGRRWGLEVHAATSAEGKSKTEFMVIRPHEKHRNYSPSFDGSPVKVGESLYITLAVSRIGGENIKNCFKYLGSYIDSELSDDIDVENRILGASKAFGRFGKKIFRNKRLSVKARVKAFRAFVLSILFYQSECWALKEVQRDKICRFYNRCVRAIAGISRISQWHRRLTTCELAAKIGLAPCEAELDGRCLAWLGHVARMEPDRLVRQMLFAWHDGSRIRGGPRQTIRHRADILLKDMSASLQSEEGGNLSNADSGFARLHCKGWLWCANLRRHEAEHGALWRRFIDVHVRSLSSTTEKRIGSRKVGKELPPAPVPAAQQAGPAPPTSSVSPIGPVMEDSPAGPRRSVRLREQAALQPSQLRRSARIAMRGSE